MRSSSKSPKVRSRPTPRPEPPSGNRALLERAVANIPDNACKWSPPGSTIDVALVYGALSVRDHGPGIDPEDLPNVFDRFYRAPTARSSPSSIRSSPGPSSMTASWVDFASGWMRGVDTLLGEIVAALPWQQGRRWM